MQPNIVFLDEYSLGDADLGSIRALGNYTGYRTTVREEVADRCRGPISSRKAGVWCARSGIAGAILHMRS